MPGFDPYHKWLGIRPEEQPANHYRLLGLTLFEDDLDTISRAADQRMDHVRSFRTGSHAVLSQQILNELAAARVCLLNQQKKAAYDQGLRATIVPPSPPPTRESLIAVEQSGIPNVEPPSIHTTHKKPMPPLLPWALVGVGGLVAVIVLILIANRGRDDQEIAKTPASLITPLGSPNVESTKAKPQPAPRPQSEPKAQPKPKVEPKPRPAKPKSPVLEDPKPLPQVEATKINSKPRQPAAQAKPQPKEPPKARLPVPDFAAQEQAMKQIKEVYGDAWAAAKANAKQQPSSKRINTLVLWNTHNSRWNDFGTDVCNVALLRGKKELWRSNGLRIPWAANKDTFLAVPVPRISADTVRVEIVRWHASGGGLSEVQVFSGKENIAQGRQATVSAKWAGEFSASTLTDGITTSAENMKGYWLLPYGTQGWAEVDLRDNSTSSLAKSLLQKAKQTNTNDAAHFVLLRLCRDIATQTSDDELAFDAIDFMASEFDISGPEMKAEFIEKAVKRPYLTPEQKTIIAEAALTVIDEAIGEDNFDTAKRVGTQASQLVRSSKNKDLLQQIVEKIKEIQVAAKAYLDAKEAMATLRDNPDDPKANLIVGKYECFTKGDWDKRLPMLAKGSDEGLKALAAKDIAGATSTKEQVKLGDAWWDVSKERAIYWYKQALPRLAGLDKDRVKKRVSENESRRNRGTGT
jgi:hypothetical protein